MLSPFTGLMQVMFECLFQRSSWTIECPHQGSDLNWNIALQSSDITNISNPLASEMDFSEIASSQRSLPTAVGMQNSVTCHEKIWSGLAGFAVIS
jgi:hypothetical protein